MLVDFETASSKIEVIHDFKRLKCCQNRMINGFHACKYHGLDKIQRALARRLQIMKSIM